MLMWLWYRLFSRCFVCDRPMALHSPWALYICERTPLPIEITDKGRELIGQSVVPESHAAA